MEKLSQMPTGMEAPNNTEIVEMLEIFLSLSAMADGTGPALEGMSIDFGSDCYPE